MARHHHRKSHRKSHRKVHRKAHRKSHRKSHSRHQHGGGNSCAALPMNRESFASQRGGEAPYIASGGSDYLVDTATRIQAEVGPLDAAFAELPSVIPRQGGGRRKSRHHRKSHKRSSRRQSRQRGGMYPIAGPSMLLDATQYSGDKTNPQFHTESSINPHYGFFKGPQ